MHAESSTPLPGRVRLLLVVLALFVPLVVDPWGADTQGAKTLVLALAGLLALALGATEALAGRGSGLSLSLPEGLLLLLAALSLTSTAWCVNVPMALLRVVALLGMFGVARGVRQSAGSPHAARLWVMALLAVGMLAVAIDAVAILNAREVLVAANAKYASRLFVHNNMAAIYVTLLTPLAVALAAAARPARRALAWMGVLGALLVYLQLLGSRAGLLGALLGLLLVAGLFALRRRLESASLPARPLGLLLALVVLAGAALPFSTAARGWAKDVFYRVVNLAGVELGDPVRRLELWRKTIELVHDHDKLGVGAGNFVVVYPAYEDLKVVMPHAHDDALQVLAEVGPLGLVLFLGLLVSTAWLLARALAANRGLESFALAAGALASLVVFALVGAFEVPLTLASTAGVLAVLIGLAGALNSPAPRPRSALLDRVPAAALLLVVGVLGSAVVAWRLPGSFLMARGEQAAAAGEEARALELFGCVASLGTGSFVPEQRQAHLALAAGDLDAALVHVRAARALWPYGIDLIEDEGRILREAGRLEEAEERYRVAVAASRTRTEAFFTWVRLLEEVGQRRQAIDRLQFEIQADRTPDPLMVELLADMLLRQADEDGLAGDEARRVLDLVAARHFYAWVLQDGDVGRREHVNRTFDALTDQLQHLPGAPDSWWKGVYDGWRMATGWSAIPAPFLYTSLHGVKIYPGWKEPLGPPAPPELRQP